MASFTGGFFDVFNFFGLNTLMQISPHHLVLEFAFGAILWRPILWCNTNEYRKIHTYMVLIGLLCNSLEFLTPRRNDVSDFIYECHGALIDHYVVEANIKED
jgi:hypothetical protein